ncbi:hypothetical protein CsSME_00009268 [Camellia sinensis var. sinensis]
MAIRKSNKLPQTVVLKQILKKCSSLTKKHAEWAKYEMGRIQALGRHNPLNPNPNGSDKRVSKPTKPNSLTNCPPSPQAFGSNSKWKGQFSHDTRLR